MRLRVILGKGFAASEVETITSHSLKATVVAYVNLWGCDFDVSELLGDHVKQLSLELYQG